MQENEDDDAEIASDQLQGDKSNSIVVAHMLA